MTGGVKRKKSSEPENLKRFRYGVKQFAQQSQRDIKTKKAQQAVVSRKERRKENRKLKKMRKLAFSQGKQLPTAESLAKERKSNAVAERARKRKEKNRNRRRDQKKRLKQRKKEEEEQRQSDLLAANKQEDKMIKQLEKQLGLKKRKSKSLPSSFINDGLGDLLDAVDPEKVKSMLDENDNDGKSGDTDFLLDLEGSDDDDDDDDLNHISDQDDNQDEDDDVPDIEISGFPNKLKGILSKKDKTSKQCRSVTFDNEHTPNLGLVTEESPGKRESEDDFNSNEDISQRSNSSSGSENEDSEETSQHSVDSREHSDSNSDKDESERDSDKDESDDKSKVLMIPDTAYKEDIYGRLRDEEGNVVENSGNMGSYIPPGKRLALVKTTDQKKKLELERMNRKLKGLVNRLSEANLQSIGSEIEEMYRHQSRAYLSESLTGIILDACIAPMLIPERLVMEHVMLIAYLHNTVASEVGALFLQELISRYDELYSYGHPYGGDKRMDNILTLLSHLYNFKVIQCVLVYDVMKKFVDNFNEKDIELLLLLLKNVGFHLRKDDAVTLKEMIITIQNKASEADTTHYSDPTRVKFMLEILMAIRNNNMRKIPNYDPSHLEHLKKLLRNYVKGGTSDSQLHISLKDLLNTERQGRWWLVGSAWSGREDHTNYVNENESSRLSALKGVSEEILELARRQRMNTDIRRNIFCIVMTSEDFVDAFEKLLRLGLKHQQEREVIHVIMDVSTQEKQFNPFYAYLVQKFCEYHRRFQMTVQFTLWDRLKILKDQTDLQINNLASLLTHLLATKAVSLSVFKVIEFSELDKGKLKLMRRVLHKVLTEYPDYVINDIFARIAPFPKLKMLREGLYLFMNHFLLKNKSKGKKEQQNLHVEMLKEKIKIAENSMGSSNVDFLL